MDKETKTKLVKALGLALVISLGTAGGLMLNSWASPRLNKMTSKPLEVSEE